MAARECDDYSDSSIRSDVSDGESNNIMYCVMHVADTHSEIKPLKAKHLKRFKECAPIWKTLTGTRESVVAEEADKISLEDLGVGLGRPSPRRPDAGLGLDLDGDTNTPTCSRPSSDRNNVNGGYESGVDIEIDNPVENGRKEGHVAGFHYQCYRCFCTISSIERKIKRRKKYEEADDPERDSLLNALLTKKRCPTSNRRQVIQSGCIICQCSLSIKNKLTGKGIHERLVSCETLGSENLIEAAILKQDKVLLKTLGGGNSDFIQAKCHKFCYLRYTKIVKVSKTVSKDAVQQQQLFAAAYTSFCKKFIEERIIRKKEILRLNELNKSFIKESADVEGKNASSHTTIQLKARLRMSYPILCFSQPTKIVRNEFVFTETLSDEHVIENNEEGHDGTGEISIDQSSLLSLETPFPVPTQDQHPIATGDQESLHVPPNVCVLCGSKRYEKNRSTRARSLEKLMTCLKGGAETLVEAAILKQDEMVLKTLRSRKSTDVQTKYHGSCYKSYTRMFTRTSTESKNKDAIQQKQLFIEAYTSFSKKFIEERIIRKKEILRLNELNKSFIKEVSNVEGKDASAHTTLQLKTRLMISYPILCFILPSKIIKTQFVFTESLSMEDMMKKKVEEDGIKQNNINQSSSSIETPSCNACEEVENSLEENSYVSETSIDQLSSHVELPTATNKKQQTTANLGQESLHLHPVDLYHAALALRATMDEIPTDSVWPTNPHVMTFDSEVVPARLFNFLAWITGLSEDQPDNGTVGLPENFKISVFSLAQDIMYLKSRSKSPKW